MNCTSAKQIPIPRLLESQGILPVCQNASGIWYHSPWSLNGDHKPSLQVSHDGFKYNDWSTGRGGTIIDLAQAIIGSNSVSQALAFIDGLGFAREVPIPSSYLRPVPTSTQKKPRIDIIATSPLHSPALLEYITTRNIPLPIAMQYCTEVQYRIAGQKRTAPYYAIGFKNNSGGFELRNARVKMASSPKDITTLGNTSSGQAYVFEGCFDCLSAMALDIFDPLEAFAVVLNSTSLIQRAIDCCKGAASACCYLDNDDAGRRATQRFLDQMPDIAADCSSLYPHSKDLNEYLCETARRNIR